MFKYFLKLFLKIFPICNTFGGCLHIYLHFPKHSPKGLLPTSQLMVFSLCTLFTSPQATEATWLADSPTIKFSKLLGRGERDSFAPIKARCSFPAQVMSMPRKNWTVYNKIYSIINFMFVFQTFVERTMWVSSLLHTYGRLPGKAIDTCIFAGVVVTKSNFSHA